MSDEDVIKAIVDLTKRIKATPREHNRCCSICERGTVHFIGDDESSGLFHIVDKNGHEMWMNPEDYKSFLDMKRFSPPLLSAIHAARLRHPHVTIHVDPGLDGAEIIINGNGKHAVVWVELDTPAEDVAFHIDRAVEALR